ncbi:MULTISPECIES: transcriptional regulator [Nocardia]|uniref:transcriptional regulator n=1 Tax=Nocardia TaxID=1817 RepID=UPI001894CA85|nr:MULTISPECIES: transcriptional regulator [Nocardia]MBF6347793.1 transcriptional regulator [Nocardia flavorosea]
MVGSRAAGSGSADLEAELVAHFRCPGPEIDAADMVTTVRHCLAAAAQDLGARPAAAATITAAAARWAREGVALESVLTACHDSARSGFEFLAARMAEAAVGGQVMADAARLLVRVVEVVTTAAATAYLDEHRIVAREHQTSAQTMVAALLGGHGVSALARRSGLRVAPAYQVVALAIPPNAEERAGGPGAVSAARRKLRRVQAALGPPLGSRSLSLLHADGGTVLIPLAAAHDTGGGPVGAGVMSAEVLQLVAEAAEAPPTAIVASGSTDQIPELAGRTHELLDRLRAGGRPPGLYRIAEGAALEPDSVVDAMRLRRLPRVPSGARTRPGKPGAA